MKQDTTIEAIERAFLEEGYITDHASQIALRLVMALGRPLLVEGPAGVGKTELAKVLSKVLNTRLIRLQCFEGLDVHSALYEWNYQKQMLHLNNSRNLDYIELESNLFSEDFLLKRPLLDAITAENQPPVLLIDEIDRADEEFEAFLLELLGEFQVTIPELGTVRAVHPPYVILTSNRTRELSDALRRRCLYQWIPYPDFDKEKAILEARLPKINESLSGQIAKLMETIRGLPLQKTPGIAESIDWAKALMVLHRGYLDDRSLVETLGCIIKDKGDWEMLVNLFEKDKHFIKKAAIYAESVSK